MRDQQQLAVMLWYCLLLSGLNTLHYCHELRRRIPIIADKYVDREFGTGALKITPGHDPNDYDIGKVQLLSVLHPFFMAGLPAPTCCLAWQ